MIAGRVPGLGLPKAVLLDMDDTILDDTGGVHPSWREAVAAHGAALGGLDPEMVRETIVRVSRWYWADGERHRLGRLALNDARREVVRMALVEMRHDAPDTAAAAIAGTYAAHRDRGLALFEGAIETIARLQAGGCRLALLTNGNAEAQREKIVRFDLARWFDPILIEGELGFGKPDPRVYETALARLGVAPHDAWMVGDNLEWDVAAPQRLGITGVWIDARGGGVPSGLDVKPDRIIRRLSELLPPDVERPSHVEPPPQAEPR